MTLMLAAASIEVMDALFGLVARNDEESYKREHLRRTSRRDWGMRIFFAIFAISLKITRRKENYENDALGWHNVDDVSGNRDMLERFSVSGFGRKQPLQFHPLT